MLISLNALKKYVHIPEPLSTKELMQLIGSRLVEVEETERLLDKYQDIYIAKVIKCTDIPDTHLHLCEIDAGEKNKEFSTLENGRIQVVCGAPNIREGILVAWLAPGAIVPETYGDENFKLTVKKLRGYESFGMITGLDELGFGAEHKYIAEIASGLARPGDKIIDAFDLDDLIINIENKSLTHRPDTFGIIGFAREVSGILGLEFKDPADYCEDFNSQIQAFKTKSSNLKDKLPRLTVEIEDPALCPRYSCVVFDRKNLKTENTSPDFPSCLPVDKDAIFLYKSGMRPISPIVDATNLVMLETGQPLHAFDYDKFIAVGGTKHAKVIIRAAKKGEKLRLLDNSEIELNETDIVVTSNNVPVALAGAMGGKSTEIDENTTRILLESATFSLYNLRRTQMAHGIFSEAITRLTKGQPAFGTIPALKMCLRRLGFTDFSKVEFADCLTEKTTQDQILISDQDINNLLGSNYAASLIRQTLQNVGFRIEQENITEGTRKISKFKVIAPLWRTDIHIKEDIVEEVGRLLGFDNVPIDYPTRPYVGSPVNTLYALKTKIRDILSSELGSHELLTYSFVSKKLQEKVGEDISDSYEIVNSISPELQCFRQSIIPNLLEKTYENQKAGYKDFTLYEMNQVAKKSFGLEEDQTPKLEHHLAITTCGDFYRIKSIISILGKRLGLDFEFVEETKIYPFFESLRSVDIILDGKSIGILGEIKRSVSSHFKLSQISAAELNLIALEEAKPVLRSAKKISRFPSVSRDLTIKAEKTLAYATLQSVISSSLAEKSHFVFDLIPASIYCSDKNTSTKNFSFHLSFASTIKTLEPEEISNIMNEIEQNILKLGTKII